MTPALTSAGKRRLPLPVGGPGGGGEYPGIGGGGGTVPRPKVLWLIGITSS
jgi:hypothetical protein